MNASGYAIKTVKGSYRSCNPENENLAPEIPPQLSALFDEVSAGDRTLYDGCVDGYT